MSVKAVGGILHLSCQIWVGPIRTGPVEVSLLGHVLQNLQVCCGSGQKNLLNSKEVIATSNIPFVTLITTAITLCTEVEFMLMFIPNNSQFCLTLTYFSFYILASCCITRFGSTKCNKGTDYPQ